MRPYTNLILDRGRTKSSFPLSVIYSKTRADVISLANNSPTIPLTLHARSSMLFMLHYEKKNSIMLDSSAKEPHLSTSEQISPQTYVRFVLCLGITPDAGHDEITQILRQGLKATATEVPVLNSLIVSVTESNGRQAKGAPRR